MADVTMDIDVRSRPDKFFKELLKTNKRTIEYKLDLPKSAVGMIRTMKEGFGSRGGGIPSLRKASSGFGSSEQELMKRHHSLAVAGNFLDAINDQIKKWDSFSKPKLSTGPDPFSFYKSKSMLTTPKKAMSLGLADDSGTDKSPSDTSSDQKKILVDSLSKSLRLFKIDLYWRWLKGTWASITKHMPIIGSIMQVISAAIGIIGTAFLLPFLPVILKVLTWLLDKSIAFFNFMQKLDFGTLDFSTLPAKIGTEIKNFFNSVDWKAIGTLMGDVMAALIKKSGEVLVAIDWENIGNRIGEFINGIFSGDLLKEIGKFITTVYNSIIEALIGILDAVDWLKLGIKIGDAVYTALNNINWLGLGELIAKAIWSALKLLVGIALGLSKGSVDAGKESPGNYLQDPGSYIAKKLFAWGTGIEMANGGIVPGIGSTDSVPAMLTPGETVIPKGQSASGNISINVNGIMDERKFRDIIQSVVNQSMQKNYSVRGGMF